jgi:putative phage-type endonuclease
MVFISLKLERFTNVMDVESYITHKLQEIFENKDRLNVDELESIIEAVIDVPELIKTVGKPALKIIATNVGNLYLERVYHVSAKVKRVNDKNVYSGKKYREDTYLKIEAQLKYLKSLPQYPQKSKKWLEQREKCISATAMAAVVNEDNHKTAQQLLFEKSGIAVPPFVQNKFTHHGNKYEEITNLAYGLNENVHVYEYGLIPSSKYTFISASPDGIVDRHNFDRTKLTKLVGRMVEIKNPYPDGGRSIKTSGEIDGGICPHTYYCQVQTQMEVCDFDECDFIQTKIEEYPSSEDFEEDQHPTKYWLSSMYNNYRGALIQLLPKKQVLSEDSHYYGRYIYPPRLDMTNDEYQQWILTMTIRYRDIVDQEEAEKRKKFGDDIGEIVKGSDYVFDKVIYWRIRQYHCITIKRDREWFAERLPIVEQHWSYITFLKENPGEKTALTGFLDKNNYKLDDPLCTAEIYRFIHQRYKMVNKDTKYQEIFQKPSAYAKPPYSSNKEPYIPAPKLTRNFFANRVNK